MKKTISLMAGICAVIGLAANEPLQAEPAAYSALANFAAALPTEPRVLDFDRMPSGMTIENAASADGITFQYDFDGLAMKVSHLYATTSAPNFLGTVDGGMFHDGDDFTLAFPPGRAIGLFFISADPLLDGDITVSAAGKTAALVAEDVHAILSDGSRVYFLGIVDEQGAFTNARVHALPGGFFLYNVDDIMTAPLHDSAVAAAGRDYSATVAADR